MLFISKYLNSKIQFYSHSHFIRLIIKSNGSLVTIIEFNNFTHSNHFILVMYFKDSYLKLIINLKKLVILAHRVF